MTMRGVGAGGGARRAGLTALALVGGGVLTGACAAGALHALPGSSAPGVDPSATLVGTAAALAAAGSAWLTFGLLVTVIAGAPGRIGEAARALRDRCAPAVVQRWAAVLLGASVGAGVLPGTAVASVQVADPVPGWSGAADGPVRAGAATQAPSPPPRTGSGKPPASAPSPGWVPRRPPARSSADAGLLTGHPRAVDRRRDVVVTRGDTLWSIAAAHLGAGAGDAEISRAWPRWYAANRSAIGPDPHDLRPGTRLRPPASTDVAGR